MSHQQKLMLCLMLMVCVAAVLVVAFASEDTPTGMHAALAKRGFSVKSLPFNAIQRHLLPFDLARLWNPPHLSFPHEEFISQSDAARRLDVTCSRLL